MIVLVQYMVSFVYLYYVETNHMIPSSELHNKTSFSSFLYSIHFTTMRSLHVMVALLSVLCISAKLFGKDASANHSLPVVMWHGMGKPAATCFSLLYLNLLSVIIRFKFMYRGVCRSDARRISSSYGYNSYA